MRVLGDTDPEKLAYLTQGIAAIQQDDLALATRNIRIFENLHRASPRYQQGIGELVTDILGHPIETFSREFKEQIAVEQSPPIGVEFVDVTEQLGFTNVKRTPVSSADISLIDYDGDGNLDLYLTPKLSIYRNTGGQFRHTYGFEADNPTAVFADLNKDGTQDLLLQLANSVIHHQMDETGIWQAVSPVIHYQLPVTASKVLHPVDYDHDGDLDLFSGRSHTTMYQNNGDETFTDVTEQTFVTTDTGDVPAGQGYPTAALSADFDDDGDIDIFVIHSETGCTRYDNLRQGRLRAISSETGIPQNVRYTAAATGDYDNDGDFDLFLATADRLHLYRNDGDGSFVDTPEFRSRRSRHTACFLEEHRLQQRRVS